MIVEESLAGMGAGAVAPRARLLGPPDRVLEKIVFKNEAMPDGLPDVIRRILTKQSG